MYKCRCNENVDIKLKSWKCLPFWKTKFLIECFLVCFCSLLNLLKIIISEPLDLWTIHPRTNLQTFVDILYVHCWTLSNNKSFICTFLYSKMYYLPRLTEMPLPLASMILKFTTSMQRFLRHTRRGLSHKSEYSELQNAHESFTPRCWSPKKYIWETKDLCPLLPFTLKWICDGR